MYDVYFFKIPTLASWHSDGTIFIIGNDKGQFQHFDISLSCIKSQTLSEEVTPANILDLSSYFRYRYFKLFHLQGEYPRCSPPIAFDFWICFYSGPFSYLGGETTPQSYKIFRCSSPIALVKQASPILMKFEGWFYPLNMQKVTPENLVTLRGGFTP